MAHLSQIRLTLAGSLALVTFSLFGCSDIARLEATVDLPSQELTSAVPLGSSRVVFFNASNSFLYGPDGSGKINLYVDKEAIGTIPIKGYVQLFLVPGAYDLDLHHEDIWMFEDSYSLQIADTETFVKIYCKVTSTAYEVVENLPDDFGERYDARLLSPE